MVVSSGQQYHVGDILYRTVVGRDLRAINKIIWGNANSLNGESEQGKPIPPHPSPQDDPFDLLTCSLNKLRDLKLLLVR